MAVCTRDRPEDLRRCLAAIQLLEPAPAAVLVVDNGSADDRTRRVVEAFGLSCVREPRLGLDWARNRALLEARTGIVAFTDDDVLVHPRWIAGIARAFTEEPGAVGVTGLVAPAELATPAQVLFEAYGGFGRGYARQWMSVAVETGEVAARVHPGTGGAGTGANMAVRREETLALGGFDPALDVGTPTGGGGDLEMYFRVLAAGHLLVYEPSAAVYHVHRRTESQLLRQMRGHGTGTYSIFAGAALRYGKVQAGEFLAFALWWALHRHLRAHVGQLLRRRPLPWALDRAETRGMCAAVLGRYYTRARRQAVQQQGENPDEPRAPALVRPRARRTRDHTPDPVVTVDLARDGGESALRQGSPVGDSRARRVRLVVERNGVAQAHLVVRTGGSPLTPSRLRWSLVQRLGPAVLEPGAVWQEPPGPRARRGSGSDAVAPHVQIVVVSDGAEVHGRPALDAVSAQSDLIGASVTYGDSPGAARPGEHGRVRRHTMAGDGGAQPAEEVLVLLRSDLLVAPGWLQELLVPLADPGVAVVTGRVLPAGQSGTYAQWRDYQDVLDRGPHRAVFDGDWLRSSRGPARLWEIGTLANAAVRCSALSRLPSVAGPAALTGAVVSEDFFYRVLHAGGRIAYAPAAVARRVAAPADRTSVRAEVASAATAHVASLLNVVVEHRDLRGLVRLGVVLPRQRLRRIWHVLRGRDDIPADLVVADLAGLVRGLAWWRWRAG
ncbi:glycosyltransferase family 2 protein [Geodermatophilus telluris]|uniref:glycosyltransferase family 2 protein n=1 Tax=Geodermatophilus telluris TaxID=1190417 RepID=UPI001586FA1A|nr:glycosyltransferase [Geodermatophilus telluris]